jgi:integrase
MSRLPRDWRERVFAAVQARKQTRVGPPSQLAAAVATLWCTGCRPAELEAGVEICRRGGILVLRVKGAKVGKIDNGETVADRGISQRVIGIDPDLHPGARYLYDLAPAEIAPPSPPAMLTVAYKAQSIRNRVLELGREVVGNLKDPPSISPYSFRHGMAADLKSCDDLTDFQRAQVMGHLSVESLESYGRRRRGGGGPSPVLKVASKEQPHGTRERSPVRKQVQASSQAQRRG